jgi:basic amino acid/polyamine antiporter, APA family
MGWKQFSRKKTLEILMAEMAGEHRLHRVLGPISLTSLGVGAIIGAGIFVMTGRAAAEYSGPAIMVSYAIAAVGCVFAALCYAEFASMAPVAGSAYTYAYTTLGEIFAWIIGWDLMLEYAMSCATVASAWTHYLNEFLKAAFKSEIPAVICSDPFTPVAGYEGTPWLNLPAVLIMLLVTAVLVRGIRESAMMNATLVIIKLAVVLFVIGVGVFYVNSENWTEVPISERIMPEELAIPVLAKEHATEVLDKAAKQAKAAAPSKEEIQRQAAVLEKQLMAAFKIEREAAESEQLLKNGEITEVEAQTRAEAVNAKYVPDLPETDAQKKVVAELMVKVRKKATEKWGLLGEIGINRWLLPLDDATRSRFAPYGLSGIMLGASIVFFAFIGFDSISTHAEEAKKPQRDVPFGILTSLVLCTVLYIAVSAVITGMIPYPKIDRNAAIAAAFGDLARTNDSPLLKWSHGLIAAGGLAGMTSVLLITFLSQVRVFMAMSRDGLLPRMFGEVHPRFKTPHLATMLTGGFICLVTAFTPIQDLEKMVNIGTLLAFVVVCGSVLALRIQRPEVHRPFRCPMVFVMAPAGVFVNVLLMLFLPLNTWGRLVGWLAIGMVIYLFYSQFHSRMGHATLDQLRTQGTSPTDAPLDTGE